MKTRTHGWRRFVLASAGLILLLLGGLAAYVGLVLDWRARPLCHKQIMLSLSQWQNEHHTTAFPDAAGRSQPSLAELREQLASPEFERRYRYVPGLNQDDPGHLVLLYLAEPTRWIWHGSPRSRFAPVGWIVVPLDFASDGVHSIGARLGEQSEWVPETEFKRRLRETLDFLRLQERPNWESVVAEHSRFLDELGHPGR